MDSVYLAGCTFFSHDHESYDEHTSKRISKRRSRLLFQGMNGITVFSGSGLGWKIHGRHAYVCECFRALDASRWMDGMVRMVLMGACLP